MYDGIWKKRFLIPFWTVQVVFLVIYCIGIGAGIAVYKAALLVNTDDDDNSYFSSDDQQVLRDNAPVAFAVLGVYLAICLICLLMDVVEMVLFARKRLSPKLMVIFGSITTAVWVVIMVLNLYAVVRYGGTSIWPIILLASYFGKLIYASVLFHRFRKGQLGTRGVYAPTNVESGYAPYSTPDAPAPYNPQLAKGGSATEYYSPAQVGQQYEMNNTAGRP